ncbi:hypothetical protein A1O1_06540 [Capronia coronata CBS 617.96]|uniref:C2H2-type domain-containing protein n=1 Tax=Capronia coronata CBS 617.96 TaxID=1182541 RepID=W9Y938_9EURO|nr:uncharacterized protein A1O1_06540 [Capronia coronata CBS 617.96]EXJ86170.1 hypothetical protein A1O1_06540 [Capronia coronata CBS 617.96]
MTSPNLPSFSMFNTTHAGQHGQFQPAPPSVVVSPRVHETLPTATMPAMTDPDMQRSLGELISHDHFEHYYLIIYSYLDTSAENWQRIVYIRAMKGEDAEVWLQHHRSIFDTPPPDIFNLIADLRHNKSWETSRAVILSRVKNSRQNHDRSLPRRPRRSRRVTSGSHLTPNTPYTPSTRSRSRDSHLRTSHSRPSLELSGSGYRQPGRRVEPDNFEESPTPAYTHVSTASASRTAPEGCRYHCSSRNCRKDFARQGDLENHLDKCHPELNTLFPLSNPRAYLRPVSQTIRHTGPDVFQDDPIALPVPGNGVVPNAMHSFHMSADMHTHTHTAAQIPSQAGDDACDTLSADTVRAMSRDVMGAIGQDIPRNVQTMIGSPFTSTGAQISHNPGYEVQHDLGDGDRGVFSVQNIANFSNFPDSYYENNPFMQGG